MSIVPKVEIGMQMGPRSARKSGRATQKFVLVSFQFLAATSENGFSLDELVYKTSQVFINVPKVAG